MKKILTVIGLLFLMVACSSTEEVKSSGKKERSYRTSTNQTTVRNIGKFQVDSSSYVATGKNERIQFGMIILQNICISKGKHSLKTAIWKLCFIICKNNPELAYY